MRHTNPRRCPVACISLFMIILLTSLNVFAEEFKNAREAYNAGVRKLRDKETAATQAPLEAALRLAEDDDFRIKCYDALMPAYRLSSEIDKMVEACEFIMSHSRVTAKRSLTGRALVSFLRERGKLESAVERYESQLKGNADDVVALQVLTLVYTLVDRKPERANELKEHLAELDRDAARQRALQFEKDAADAPRLEAWNWKEAAVAWLEADDPARAKEAAKKAVASGPEARSSVLTMYWHEALGDVFLKVGEARLAIERFEIAVDVAISDIHRKGLEKKLAEAKAAADKAP